MNNMNQVNMPPSGSRFIRFGTTNPTIMEEPFWKYMICNPQLQAHNVQYPVGANVDSTMLPRWCFARFGATQTYLRDGRLICIGGEHEDYYDPDFQIYNDVVVIENPPIPNNFPSAEEIRRETFYGQMWGPSTVKEKDVTIYGYPLNVFPPTDFHTATYLRIKGKEFIYIIGGTGCTCDGRYNPWSCKSDHHIKETRVFRLCASDFSIEHVETTGNIPRGYCTYLNTAKLLRVCGRLIIEIEPAPVIIESCSSPGWESHHRVYRLDIDTSEWTIFES